MYCFLSYSSFRFISCAHARFERQPDTDVCIGRFAGILRVAWLPFETKGKALFHLCPSTSFCLGSRVFFFMLDWENLGRLNSLFQSLFQTYYFMVNSQTVISDQTQCSSTLLAAVLGESDGEAHLKVRAESDGCWRSSLGALLGCKSF